METELYKKAEKFVINSFAKTDDNKSIKHLLRTAYWLKQLKSDADQALCIAAVSHDIERAFRESNYDKNIFKVSTEGFLDKKHNKHHQEKGAEIMMGFLKKENANKNSIKKVKMLILNHEYGGNDDQNLLKDADSTSYFENNAEHFALKKVKIVGKEKVKEKFDWMYNRITSEKAKKICLPWYKQAIEKLNDD